MSSHASCLTGFPTLPSFNFARPRTEGWLFEPTFVRSHYCPIWVLQDVNRVSPIV